ncbi:class I SAM-dependent methyltransferase [Sandaracinobacter neustonicus]|nr:methyltransferase domain-containing protein [Sandaracinobacter neustonicus]
MQSSPGTGEIRPVKAPIGPAFPAPDRPVASIASATWSDEDARDNDGEAEDVIRRLGIRPGMHIADIGAGSGYYTIRLSPVVGLTGRIVANDIIPDYLARLRKRSADKGLTNVDFTLGDAGDANLASQSVDLALMAHMYHEISEPFALLWRLQDDLKPGGRLAILDSDRPTARHGTPPALLRCELAAAGYQQIAFNRLENGRYLTVFQPTFRPDPGTIRPCKAN